MMAYDQLRHAGLLAGEWDDWRQLRRPSHEKTSRRIPSMLKPDDPGLEGDDQYNRRPPAPPPIEMMIGPWRREANGVLSREIMSVETFWQRHRDVG
jgi:hypothetical protein